MNILLLIFFFAFAQALWVLAASLSFVKGIRARRWRLYLETHGASALLANVKSIFLEQRKE